MSGRLVIGKPLRRVDGRAKVTGQTRFADDLALPRHAVHEAAALDVPHARIRAVDTARAAAHPGVKLVLTGARLPHPLRHPAGLAGRARAVHRPRALRRRPGGGGGRRRRADRLRGAATCIDVDYEPLTTIADAEEALATPEPRIHDYGDEGNVHKKVALDFGDVDEALAGADQVFEDVFFFEGNTHLPIEQHATLAYLDPDGKLVVGQLDPDAALPAPRPGQGARSCRRRTSASWPRPTAAASAARADPFNHEIVAAKAALVTGPAGQDRADPRGGLLLPPRPPPGADEASNRRSKNRTGFKIAGQELQTLLDGGAYGSYGVASTFYTGALQTVTYQIAALPLPRLPRLHQQAALRAQARPRHAPAALRARGPHRQDLRARWASTRPSWRIEHAVPADSLTANWLRVGSMGLVPLHRGGGAQGSGLAAAAARRQAAGAAGAAWGSRCGSYLCGAGLPIYWNQLPHSGVQLKLDRSGGWRRSAAPPRSARAPTTCWWRSSPRCWASIRSTSAASPATQPDPGRPRQLQLARHADDGPRGDRGGGAGARDAGRGRAAKSSGCPRAAGVRRAPRLRRREPGERRRVRRGGAAGRGALRHARHHRQLPSAHARPATTRARAWGRRRRTPTRPPWSRSRSIPRPAGCACPRCGWRTTSAAPSTRCWRAGRSRGRSTWGSARR